MPVGEKQIFRFGPFQLDTQCGQLRRDGVGLKLQGQPVQIIEILLKHPGQLVTREELRERLWASDTFVDFDHSLNTAIKKLRQVLGDEADTPRYIETLPRRGYRFIGEVNAEGGLHKISEGGAQAGEEFITKVATTLVDAAITAADDSRRRVRWLSWMMAIAVVGLLASATLYWLIRPMPMPRVVGSHPVTRTGYKKAGTLVTDGKNVYFQEYRPTGLTLMQVHLSGGELSEIAVTDLGTGGLRDISNDGSELLLAITNHDTGRSDAWIQPLPRGPLRLVTRDARWPRFTPDGRGMIFLRNEERDLYRMNFDGTEVRRLGATDHVTDLSVSPDGRRIRFRIQWGSELWEAGLDGSNTHRIVPNYQGRVFVGNWSPNGEYYFFSGTTGDRNDLWVVRETQPWSKPADPQPVQLTFGPMWIGSPIVSKDGSQLYAVAAERLGSLFAYDHNSKTFVPYLSGLPACYVDFSRDKQWVTYVSYPDGSLWRSRIDGTQRRQLTVPPLAVINPRWSPDGKFIAFTDISGGDRSQMAHSGNHRIYLVSAEGGEPLLLLAGEVGDPTWSPDGTLIAYGYHAKSGSEIRILDLETRTSRTVPGSQNTGSPRWSPDGEYLAAFWGGIMSKLMLFSFATQQWEELASGDFGWPSWSHDSKFVYVSDDARNTYDRIAVSNHKREQVASLMGVRTTAYFYWSSNWLGLTPDDRPITTLSTGVEEIYAFDLEYK
jgi:Tol biopolymer transport system component/DNA-binding winged helix-turn-helix (wHTH) protein